MPATAASAEAPARRGATNGTQERTGWGPRGGQRVRGGRRRRRPHAVFVLSGGASLGALQVGMLRALCECGIVPDLLVGTSAGALIGGVTGHRDHLFPDRGLRQLVNRQLDLELLEEAQVPLHVPALDLTSGDELLLSHGPAIDAVLAATAIPGLLPPVRWGERLLVDGGVVNTPISHAVELGAERVYVLPTQVGSPALPARPRGALDAAVHGLTLLVGARLESDLRRYGDEAEPAANSGHVQPTDFDRSSRLIGEGLAAARALRSGAGARRVAS